IGWFLIDREGIALLRDERNASPIRSPDRRVVIRGVEGQARWDATFDVEDPDILGPLLLAEDAHWRAVPGRRALADSIGATLPKSPDLFATAVQPDKLAAHKRSAPLIDQHTALRSCKQPVLNEGRLAPRSDLISNRNRFAGQCQPLLIERLRHQGRAPKE